MLSPLLALLTALSVSALAADDSQAPAPEPSVPEAQHTNRLADQTSPYLLQHAHNPVDWYPWGPEALALAKSEDKPIFLSIGYSACHWCHVMERESFENEKIAAVMNEHFVCIKVDREERPDIDEIYMKFVVATTGSGGWPMSVWLTPELEPFFGGTYFPPDQRYGRQSFPQILEYFGRLWKEDRPRLEQSAAKIVEQMHEQERRSFGGELDPGVLDRSLESLSKAYDPTWGGFGDAPKFPHSMDVRILLRHWKRTGSERALQMATSSLDHMANGGIYDHLGGGFARYSTDEKWLIPHFEKMLYDNALLVPAYLEAFLITGEERYARVVRETLDWVLREMSTPEGGFGSTLDADSEGEEGKFYAWTPAELESVLGAKRAHWAAEWFDVTDTGNFEHGKSALWRPKTAAEVAEALHVDQAELEAAMAEAVPLLFAARAKRIRPGYDDKVLAAWNGLMISAMAQAAQILGEERYLDAARTAANYVLTDMRQEDGRLYATARHGRAHLNATLDDYVFLIAGLIDLYETDFDERWLREALALDEVLGERFWDAKQGGYFTTGEGHEALILRIKGYQDGALPAGNGVQVLNLMRLAELTGSAEHAKRAEKALKSQAQLLAQYPQAFSQALQAVDLLAAGAREIVIAGEPDSEAVEALLREVRGTFLPQRVVALAAPGADAELIPLLESRDFPEGGARAYVCRDYTCKQPVETPEALAAQLAEKN